MEDLKKKREAALKAKFEAMKKEHQQETEDDDSISEDEKHTGVITEIIFKNNLWCC